MKTKATPKKNNTGKEPQLIAPTYEAFAVINQLDDALNQMRALAEARLGAINQLGEVNTKLQAELSTRLNTIHQLQAENQNQEYELARMSDNIATLIQDKSNLEKGLYAGLTRSQIEQAIEVCLLICRPGLSDIHNEAWNRLQDIKATLDKVKVRRLRSLVGRLRRLVKHG
jgi:hypothetical protein